MLSPSHHFSTLTLKCILFDTDESITTNMYIVRIQMIMDDDGFVSRE